MNVLLLFSDFIRQIIYLEIHLVKYNLPDFQLFENTESDIVKIWVPEETIVVLGQSNTSEKALKEESILSDTIPVYKRPSGGQAVVLTPNTIIISIVFITSIFNNPRYYFKLINEKIINTLTSFGLENIFYRGISDIAIGEKKILGSSIYRRKEKLLYHAVLNVAEPVSTFEKYLKHPEKEPDYRKGRNHGDFVTSLKEQGCTVGISEIADRLREALVDLEMR